MASSSDFNACDHCAKPIKPEEEFIECMGFCNQQTHVKCAKINSPFKKVIVERTNIFWMCCECVNIMKLTRFKSAMSSIGNALSKISENHSETIADIKQAISDNGKQIELLSRRINSTPLSSRGIVGLPTPKRRREEQSMTLKPLLGGTKTLSNNSATVMTVSPPKEKFWLYMSRIHPSVKTDDIKNMVKDCLQCEDQCKVIPLIRKDVDINSLNFISFKIGIEKKYQMRALDPATWPKGILFREFESDTSSKAWLPTNPPPRIALSSASDENFLSPNSATSSTNMVQ